MVSPCGAGVGHRVQLHGQLPQLGEGGSGCREDLAHLQGGGSGEVLVTDNR